MKDRVDKSRGIVALSVEALAKIKPTETLRLAKQAEHRKRNFFLCLLLKDKARAKGKTYVVVGVICNLQFIEKIKREVKGICVYGCR
jgi:hypothetical protein